MGSEAGESCVGMNWGYGLVVAASLGIFFGFRIGFGLEEFCDWKSI